MKVWEAIDILRSVDANAEVTLTFTSEKVKTYPQPNVSPTLFPKEPIMYPPAFSPWYKVTCKTVQ